ncbi:DUF896 domain-containing protein [Alkalihalobacillus sp. AL-G]|uniref:DUF896 domain-containing protein n=1 Tax=Alkalihalobacillus sp. AL-G TaxID=2926399 RepID=UPI00272A927C|nr:DUF896 domain-containing protein [Alkalihalobacillus sp. AL-G]WLD95251.1 DUF896 domain-containing protein [Alkalihalobacillus sp. AL-G]
MLPKHKIDRINELSRKSKSEGLNPKEKDEQKKLREEYLKAFRGDFKKQLHNVKIVDPEGNDVTPEKLKNEKKRNH